MSNPYDDIKDERDRLGRRTRILAGQLEQRRTQHAATIGELREARARIAELEAKVTLTESDLGRARDTLRMAVDVLAAELGTR